MGTRTPKPNQRIIHVQLLLDEDEKKAMDQSADARNLPTTMFIRLVVAGAITRGGGLVDRLLMDGESILGTPKRVRGGTHSSNWAYAEPGRWVHKNGQWEIIKRDPKLNAQSRKSKDPHWWWQLRRYGTEEMIPMSFRRSTAMVEADRYIAWGPRKERNGS